MIKLLISSLLLASPLYAADTIMQDFDSLGGNDALLEQANALQSKTKIKIVQNRVVNRNQRHEGSIGYNQHLGGDSYVKTNAVNARYDYHFNPRWSLGLNYTYNFNELSDEGENLINEFNRVPEIDWIEQSYFVNLNWYPIYGKFSLYDMGVVHFDMYALLGLGEVSLKSGTSSSYNTGMGLAFWFSQHLTGRIEFKYQNYTVQRFNGEKDINATIAGISMGYLL